MNVFDFDKTLTYKDTLLGFYLEVIFINNKIKIILLPIYFIFMIFHKYKIIDNECLKKIGVYLFLKNISRIEIEKIATKYSRKVKLNKLYAINKIVKNKIILTGSFEIYVKKILEPEYKVYGSKLIFSNDKVQGLKFNMYGENKLIFFKENFSNETIEEFYTDSLTDLPIMKIANKNYFVKGDKIDKIYA